MSFFATVNASATFVVMTSIAVDATAAIALVVVLDIVTHVAVTATALATATLDTGIATAAITSNDGHSTLLSRSA